MYLDKNHQVIDLKNKSHDEDYYKYTFSFRKTVDSGYVYIRNVDAYLKMKVNHAIVRENMEQITNQKFSDTATFIIDYNYYDDDCGWYSTNNVSRSLIKERESRFYSFNKDAIQKLDAPKIFYLFDKKIKLDNKPENKKETFFIDSDDFFRNTFFRIPTKCGAKLLIKPNGDCYLINGETSITELVNFALKKE
jgi:hypothetical protein